MLTGLVHEEALTVADKAEQGVSPPMHCESAPTEMKRKTSRRKPNFLLEAGRDKNE